MALDTLREKVELYNGFGTAWSRAFEMVLTPLVLALIGLGIDQWVGTRPVFTLGLFFFGLAGVVARIYYAYDRDMARHEADAPWVKRP